MYASGSVPLSTTVLARRPARSAVVLVTDGDERSALAVVRSLGRSGKHMVHVCSRRGHSLAGASRFARSDSQVGDALSDPSEFAERVSAVARRLQADVVLPVSEASVLAVLAQRDLFDFATVPYPDLATFRRVCDKSAVLKTARELGIATPSQHVITTEAQIRDILERGELQFPVVIKPARSVIIVGTRREKIGVSYASNPDELALSVAKYGATAYPLLLQQRIVGPGVGVFLLRWAGETLAVFSHRRVREKPPSGGVSVCSESTILDPSLLAGAEALLERLGWSGVAMVEYKVDQVSGTPYLMEINGRFWGSLQLAISAGVDFPGLLIAAATGREPTPVSEYRVGIRNRWWWGEIDHVLTRLRHSNEAALLGADAPNRLCMFLELVRWRANDRNEILQLDDVRPFFRETALWLRRARTCP